MMSEEKESFWVKSEMRLLTYAVVCALAFADYLYDVVPLYNKDMWSWFLVALLVSAPFDYAKFKYLRQRNLSRLLRPGRWFVEISAALILGGACLYWIVPMVTSTELWLRIGVFALLTMIVLHMVCAVIDLPRARRLSH